MFAFGIGSGVNRFIIEGMAHVGMGEPFVIDKPEAAAAQAEKFRKYIATPVLTGIGVAYNEFEVYDVEPKTIPDVLAERPIIIFGKWRGQAEGSIVVTGTGGNGEYSKVLRLADASSEEGNSALRYLWARHMVQILADYNNLREDSGRVKEITALGLKYSLLTQYTSFVAIDKKVRNVGGKQEVVEQALPLPQGVSDYAVGGGAAAGFAGGGMGKSVMYAPSAARSISADEQQALPETPPPPVGTVKVGKIEIQGGVAERTVRLAVEKRLAEIVAAYSAERPDEYGYLGEITVAFTLGADGQIRDVKALVNDLTPSLGQAVIQFVESLSLANTSGSDATIKVTFKFRP
jgi:Ca-activated chloride channel family protein